MRKVFNVTYEIYLFTDFDPKTMPERKVIGVTDTEEKARDYCAVWNWKHKKEMPFTRCCYTERMEEVLEP